MVEFIFLNSIHFFHFNENLPILDLMCATRLLINYIYQV